MPNNLIIIVLMNRVAYENITSIKGVGQIAGIVLLHLFLKYPDANQRQITSLTGLNPIYKQSGSSIQSGYKIAKSGASLYRSVLFMSVLAAVQHDKNFRAFYERLKSNSKHTTSAQIAVMRKIILTAHSLYKTIASMMKISTLQKYLIYNKISKNVTIGIIVNKI